MYYRYARMINVHITAYLPNTELQYKTSVIPTSIRIYETYHPGAVVKILACNADPKERTVKRSGEVEYV
jgi:hypothetical protein